MVAPVFLFGGAVLTELDLGLNGYSSTRDGFPRDGEYYHIRVGRRSRREGSPQIAIEKA